MLLGSLADICQGRQTWPTYHPQTVSSVIETIHALAIGYPYPSLAVCRSKLCQNCWTRITRTFRELVQSFVLSGNMDPYGAGCGLLDGNEDQK